MILFLSELSSAESLDLLSNKFHTGSSESNYAVTIDSQRIDQLTAKALQAIARDELTLARATLQELVNDFPTYRLGHLLFAELHSAKTALPSSFSRSHYTQPFMELLLEASTRLAHSDRLAKNTFSADNLPTDIIKLGTGLKHWVQVDLEQGTQSVFDVENGELIKRWEQYIGYGAAGFDKFKEGDLKTPLGVYRIEGFRDDPSLPELYGSGALMLDYPNLSDRYENRTGSGIWLHGVPRSNLTRGPLSSEGCVIMGNDYLDALHSRLNTLNTLVALSSASAIKHPNIDVSELEIAFLKWQAEVDESDKASEVRWEDVTVVVSGASAITGEPQNITFYFPLSIAYESTTEPAGFKALFWQRQTPGVNQWKLVGDEIRQSRT